MKKETGKVVEGTFGRLREVEDFLPSPEELAKAPVTVNVKIGLSLDTLEFLKEHARQHNTSYQQLIRQLLDEYVAKAHAVEEAKHA